MSEFMSVRAYAERHELQLSEEELADLDREMYAHCLANDIPIKREYRLSEAQLEERLLRQEQVGYGRACEDMQTFVRDLMTALEAGRVMGSPVEVAHGMLRWIEQLQRAIFPEADAPEPEAGEEDD